MRPVPHLLRDLKAIDVGGDRIQGHAGLAVLYLGCQELVCQRDPHGGHRFAAFLLARLEDRRDHVVEVTPQRRLQQGTLVGEVLVQGADRNAGALGNARRRQSLLAYLEQNLKCRFQHGVDTGGRTRLNGRLSG